jgi:hypothetical protein
MVKHKEESMEGPIMQMHSGRIIVKRYMQARRKIRLVG